MGKKESRNSLNTDENAAPSSLAFHWPGLEGYEALGLEGSRTPQHRFFHYYEERNKIEKRNDNNYRFTRNTRVTLDEGSRTKSPLLLEHENPCHTGRKLPTVP